jgi:iron complex transport system permease protein
VAVAGISLARRFSGPRRRLSTRLLILAVLVASALLVALVSLAVGARDIPLGTVWEAMVQPDRSISDHLVVRDLRVPRLVAGLVVGAALGVAGVLMQGITRNPLADPGILGVNAGASLGVVLAIWLLGFTNLGQLMWFSFAGAGVISAAVYALGSLGRGSATPLRLALAGSAMTSLILSLVQAILLSSQDTLDTYRFWVVGSLSGSETLSLAPIWAPLALGLLLALLSAHALNAVALGDDAARSLGVSLGAARGGTLAAVALLCGVSVAIAGPVAFVGLVVPHVARALMGPDQRLGLLASLAIGPILVVGCDVLGRIVMPPGEVQVGIMTGIIGGPAFVLVVRRMRILQP